LPAPAETQWPLVHCVSSVHEVPRSPVVTHTPDLHAYPVAQSDAVELHDVLQPAPPH
jgi:hypothetical protein